MLLVGTRKGPRAPQKDIRVASSFFTLCFIVKNEDLAPIFFSYVNISHASRISYARNAIKQHYTLSPILFPA